MRRSAGSPTPAPRGATDGAPKGAVSGRSGRRNPEDRQGGQVAGTCSPPPTTVVPRRRKFPESRSRGRAVASPERWATRTAASPLDTTRAGRPSTISSAEAIPLNRVVPLIALVTSTPSAPLQRDRRGAVADDVTFVERDVLESLLGADDQVAVDGSGREAVGPPGGAACAAAGLRPGGARFDRARGGSLGCPLRPRVGTGAEDDGGDGEDDDVPLQHCSVSGMGRAVETGGPAGRDRRTFRMEGAHEQRIRPI